MTLEEAEKKFGISIDNLKQYISFGFIKYRETEEYCEEDFEQLGLSLLLLDAELTKKEVSHYLRLEEQKGKEAEQICLLRKHRRNLLDQIHEKQHLLDRLDYIIWNKKKVIESGGK